jgi:phage shock protein PspC (stress-responsive transcriptional regulator)
MERVITINLNGKAYQLDDTAYDALRAYLDHAGRALTDNADRAEILADFEQAIAEKCDRVLGPHKTVVTRADMDRILAEMGPVEGQSSAAAPDGDGSQAAGTGPTAHGTDADEPRSPPKRLYRIREGSMFSGVCAGLAAYFGVDVTMVRLIFIAGTFLSAGAGVLVYWVLAMVVPEAASSEEHAAAYGQPFNAQELIDHAARTAADVKNGAARVGAEWKSQWRRQRHQWRIQQRAWRRDGRRGAGMGAGAAHPMAAVALPFAALFTFLCFIALAWFLVRTLQGDFSLIRPFGAPRWVAILFIVMLFQMTTTPLRALRHEAYRGWPHPYGWLTLWDSLVGIGMTIFVLWLLLSHMGPVDNLRDFVHQAPDAVRSIAHEFAAWLQRF